MPRILYLHRQELDQVREVLQRSPYKRLYEKVDRQMSEQWMNKNVTLKMCATVEQKIVNKRDYDSKRVRLTVWQQKEIQESIRTGKKICLSHKPVRKKSRNLKSSSIVSS